MDTVTTPDTLSAETLAEILEGMAIDETVNFKNCWDKRKTFSCMRLSKTTWMCWDKENCWQDDDLDYNVGILADVAAELIEA